MKPELKELTDRSLELMREIDDITRWDFAPAVDRLFAHPDGLSDNEMIVWNSTYHFPMTFLGHHVYHHDGAENHSLDDCAIPMIGVSWRTLERSVSPEGHVQWETTLHELEAQSFIWSRPPDWQRQLGLPEEVRGGDYMFSKEWLLGS